MTQFGIFSLDFGHIPVSDSAEYIISNQIFCLYFCLSHTMAIAR